MRQIHVKFMSKVEIQSKVEQVNGSVWNVALFVEKDVATPFITKDRRVLVHFNKDFYMHSALMPDGSGDFFININKENRKKLNLTLGESVTFQLEKDNSKYGMSVPEELAALWEMDLEFNEYFHELTAGKQRTLLYLVNKMKNPDSRMKKALTICDYLKEVKGNLDFKELNLAIKNSKH